ncbi:MAG: hypothetical protein Q9160_005481 [Pyrenula sp. 1 TL-2023]
MLAIISIVFLLPVTVLSASTPDLSVYPSCARQCLSDQIQKSKCYNTDASLTQQIACLCTDNEYLSATTKCVTGACSPTDGQTTYMVGQELCQQAGVSSEQYSSAALGNGGAASATPSPSGSGSDSSSPTSSGSSGSSTSTAQSQTGSSSSGTASATGASPTGGAASLLDGKVGVVAALLVGGVAWARELL